MDELEHYLDAWGLTDPQVLAHTATSTVYTVQQGDETVVLKLLTPVGVADEQSGAVALRLYNGQGAVRLLQYDEQAHLLEYVPGADVVPLVQAGDDAGATVIIAGVLNQLHGAYHGPAPTGLVSLERRFRSLFRKAARDQSAGEDSPYIRGAMVARWLLDNPREVCVLHGDMHHENVRLHPRRGWLAFDPKGVYGERTYDAANIFCNPQNMPELVENEARILRTADILAREMKLDKERLLAFVLAYCCLSASWSLEDGQDAEPALHVAALTAPYVHLP